MVSLARFARRAAGWVGLSPARPPLNADYEGLSPRDAFSSIYHGGRWGHGTHQDFYSGSGSHEPALVDQYVAAVADFLRGFADEPDVVDLGCGDFNVGQRLRPFCGRYIAADVVPTLIERNREHFADLGVTFQCLDIADDPLPPGDVVFLRQVLQHLSNPHIAKVVPKLGSFRFAVVTEHLPAGRFAANRDMQTGAGIRLLAHPKSGVVLTERPFSMRVRSARVLCECTQYGGVIRTTAYEMPAPPL
jgi:SAM-dependent methyltransferase